MKILIFFQTHQILQMSPPDYFPAIFIGIESCHRNLLLFLPLKYFNCIFFKVGSYSSFFKTEMGSSLWLTLAQINKKWGQVYG